MKKWPVFSLCFSLIILMLVSGVAQANVHERLFYAAREGHYQSVERLLKMGADVNYANRQGETPMHGAASRGHLGIMRLLRSKGAHHNLRTTGGWFALHHAVRFGHVGAANYLLNLGTPLYVRTRDGKTVFDIARATRNQAMINFLERYRRIRR